MNELPLASGFDLRRSNTLGVRAIAEYGMFADNNADLIAAIRWADERGMPLTILGGGSNVILAPEIPGLTVLCKPEA